MFKTQRRTWGFLFYIFVFLYIFNLFDHFGGRNDGVGTDGVGGWRPRLCGSLAVFFCFLVVFFITGASVRFTAGLSDKSFALP